MELKFTILKQLKPEARGVTVFAMVRNEMYFLPHFLRHYRLLGVRHFLFLDDHSTDGTRALLLAQPDCMVLEANLGFGDLIKGTRFGQAVKSIIPNAFLMKRWVLTVDADEFLQLPTGFSTVDEMTAAMEHEGLDVSRALMVDFYPEKLAGINCDSLDVSPFALCPYFDAYTSLTWPDKSFRPTEFSGQEGVRVRMVTRLFEISAEMRLFASSYKFAELHKVPLLFWHQDTRATGDHTANVAPSDRVQLVLAHFKFYPGYLDRIASALRSNAHWNSSLEYRFLDIAARELSDWPLLGPRTRWFNSSADLEAEGLLFSQLRPSARA